MIADRLDNIFFYEKLLPNLASGMEKLNSLQPLIPGRYEFPGGYLMVQDGRTVPMDEGDFEVHRKYIDVQIILEGSEEFAWQPLSGLSVTVPYDPEKDVEFLKGTREHVFLASAGMFYAVFPEDGHKPGSHTKEPHSYKKIVMKLPVNA